MNGFNLALALLAAFLAGAGVVAYAWWSCMPFYHTDINPFGILSDPEPRDPLDLLSDYERSPEGEAKARERYIEQMKRNEFAKRRQERKQRQTH